MDEAGHGDFFFEASDIEKNSVPCAFIPHLLSSTVSELVLVGVVESSGRLEPTARGWAWRGNRGEVWMTGLEAVDGEGTPLSARLLVEPTQVRVEVQMPTSGLRLPLTISLEIGANDFRISDMGGSGDGDYDALFPAVAFNSTDNEYLVVWDGDDTTGSLVDDEYEIFGQLLDASGDGVGANDFRISDMGGSGDSAYRAVEPAVAYNGTMNQYLVLWQGYDTAGSRLLEEWEIFGQLLDESGAGVGANDFRISDMGGSGDSDYGALAPAAAHSGATNEYLVVWWGDDTTGSLVDGEYEIFGQRIAGSYIFIDGFESGDTSAWSSVVP